MDAQTLKVKSLIEDVVYGMTVPIIKGNQYTIIQPEPEPEPDPEQPDDPVTPTPPPVVDTRKIYIGTLGVATTGVTSMYDITSDHILGLTKLPNKSYDKYAINVPQNSILVVAVPSNKKVTIDNGLGEKVPFYTNVSIPDTYSLYANGEPIVTIDGETYYIYGVFVFTAGNEYIYID